MSARQDPDDLIPHIRDVDMGLGCDGKPPDNLAPVEYLLKGRQGHEHSFGFLFIVLIIFVWQAINTNDLKIDVVDADGLSHGRCVFFKKEFDCFFPYDGHFSVFG